MVFLRQNLMLQITTIGIKSKPSFGNFVGYMRDIRLYDCALTSDQIMENLYVEDPTNKHLLVYAPLTKESGLKCSVSKFQGK